MGTTLTTGTGKLIVKSESHEYKLKKTLSPPDFVNIPDWNLRRDEVVQIGLLTELPPGCGPENIFAAIDVSLRYAFIYSKSNPPAVNTAKIFIDTLTTLASIPILLITNEGSASAAYVVHKVTE